VNMIVDAAVLCRTAKWAIGFWPDFVTSIYFLVVQNVDSMSLKMIKTVHRNHRSHVQRNPFRCKTTRIQNWRRKIIDSGIMNERINESEPRSPSHNLQLVPPWNNIAHRLSSETAFVLLLQPNTSHRMK
jgi:hypothetical protein